MYLAKIFFFLDTAGSCTPRSPIIHHPCPVTPSISEAHINRKHSVVLTVEEGLCKHLSGYSAPLCHRCLDLPRNGRTSQEIGAKWHPFPTTLLLLTICNDLLWYICIYVHTKMDKYHTLDENDLDFAKKADEFTKSATQCVFILAVVGIAQW